MSDTDDVVRRLTDDLASIGVPRVTIESCVRRCYAELAEGARVHTFLPILAEREARRRRTHLQT